MLFVVKNMPLFSILTCQESKMLIILIDLLNDFCEYTMQTITAWPQDVVSIQQRRTNISI